MFKTVEEYVRALLRYFGLNESVRNDQSYEALREQLAHALNAWPGKPASATLHVAWTFSDRVIAYAWIEIAGRDGRDIRHMAWEIPWAAGEDGGFTFGAPVEVKEIRLYEPVAESRGRGQRFTETIEQVLTLTEAAGAGGRKVRAVGITADVVNGNGRRYPRAVLADAVAKLNGHLHESNGQGNLLATGEVEHPADKGGRPNLLETVVKWNAASLDTRGRVLLEGVIVPTSKGKDIATLIEHGIPAGVSMRGYGEFNLIQESGATIQEVIELTIKGFDLVAQPSDPNGQVLESRTTHQEEKKTMNVEELLKLLKEQPHMLKAVMESLNLADQKALTEALGVEDLSKLKAAIDEGRKAGEELKRRQTEEAIAQAVTEACKSLPYGELNAEFVEAVRAAKPADAAAVTALVETKRKEWDGIFAKTKLAAMGKSGVQVLGPVFERETGQPEFTRAAYALNESLVKSGEGHRRVVVKGESPAELLTVRMLERFDKLYQARLIQEARSFEEAEQTSDLNLPYSVSRMLIEQAYPELVAANVYDFGVADSSPTRIYFEAYAGESGAAPAVTDEVVTADHGVWVAMAKKRQRPGTVVVTDSGGTTTYVEGTDYVIDYEDGALMALAAGSITDGQSLKVDYTYDAFRLGEMQAIQRAKNTLTYTTLEMIADRLATQISREAIVFSRSQMNYDAVTRTLGNLARLVRRKIDKDVLYKGLAASLRQASNSGGTWTAASDPVAQFVEKIGVAKVKVYNRNYVPTSILMSVTNADRLSNWDGFTREGFPNAMLTAAGFAGSIKGLPIFASTEYTDSYAQAVNRELVAHRVYQPMQIFGPFPSYDSNGNLIGADQYYNEEFNGSVVPVIEKTAHVVIV